MNNETNIISFEQKKEFILKYLFDNFSTSKEEFLIDNNISEEYLCNQLPVYSMTKSDYFLVNVFFTDKGLFLRQPTLINDFQDNKFFVIKALDKSQREYFQQFEKINLFITYSLQEKFNFYQKIIIEKNEFISFLIQFTDNSSHDNLFFPIRGEINLNLQKLYDFILDKSILDNF